MGALAVRTGHLIFHTTFGSFDVDWEGAQDNTAGQSLRSWCGNQQRAWRAGSPVAGSVTVVTTDGRCLSMASAAVVGMELPSAEWVVT